MSTQFELVQFSKIDHNDHFFDSLKEDYPEFETWFIRKANKEEKAFVYFENGVKAFLYLKKENVGDDNSPLVIDGRALENKPRIKIGTLKISDETKGQRLGEGAIGLALWHWQESEFEEIYITVFEKHNGLLDILRKYGFEVVGKKENGELVLIKNRKKLCLDDPFKAFPFINGSFKYAKLIPIYESFHDRLFPYSELYYSNNDVEGDAAGNGITKMFIATPFSEIKYESGQPVLIYRIFDGEQKGFKSAVTSFCTITNVYRIKTDYKGNVSYEDFVEIVGNKTVYTKDELAKAYGKKNVVVLEMVYNGYFGKGNNIIYNKLKSMNLFNAYPYELKYTKEDFIKILEIGKKNVQNIIIDQS